MTVSHASTNPLDAIPKALRERLRERRVIPFVGAGVSMAVNHRQTGKTLFPSWKSLLLAAADRLEEENKRPDANIVRGFLQRENPNYLEAAKNAREGLGSIWFEFLKDQIDLPRGDVFDSSLDLARAVWQLGNQLVITTNYDRVLRWACAQADDIQEWDIEAPAEQAHFLGQRLNRPTVWHLHGQIGNKTGLILTPDGYERLYPDKETECKFPAALTTLRSCLASHTFLFVGFSLDDEHFGAQLKAIADVYQSTNGPHYALVKEAHRFSFKQANPSIEVIPFPDFGEPLVNLVTALGEIARSANTATATSPAPSPIEVSTPTTPSPGANYGLDNPVFFVPFRAKAEQVIGREDALLQVHKQLTEGRRTAIGQAASFLGLGGLGKTQLAVEYAYRYQEEYPNGVIWITADEDIDAQLVRLVDKAGWLAPQSEHKDKLDVARNRLRSYSNCLIIFDNLENLESIREYLPLPEATPHLLVTTRHEFAEFPPVPLELLDEQLSFELLVQEAARALVTAEEEQAARAIARELGGLPLALELAGAYLRHREAVSWSRYLELLRQRPREALAGKHLSSFTRHEADLYATLRIEDEILAEEPRLREIIDLLAWSDSAPMGIELMCALLGVADSLELTGALALGVALRLIQKTPGVERYTLHRLVSQVRREDISLSESQVNSICQRLGDWFYVIRKDFQELLIYETEINHLRAWQQQAEVYAKEHASRLLWLQAYPPYQRGHYHEAKCLVESALKLYEENRTTDHELEAHLLSDLEALYGEVGEYYMSLEYAERALAIWQKVYSEAHPNMALSLNNIGYIYGKLGQHSGALDYHKRALAIWQKVYSEANPDTARSLNNIGSTYGELGNHQKALEYKEEALAIWQKVYGEAHPDTATSLNNVGSTYGELGKHQKALEYKERALTIRQKVYGEAHPDTIDSVINLAVTLFNCQRFYEAGNLLERTLLSLSKGHIRYVEAQQLLQRVKQRIPGAQRPRAGKTSKKKKRR
jgi:tetratricopeptide (TPR) repeat protein